MSDIIDFTIHMSFEWMLHLIFALFFIHYDLREAKCEGKKNSQIQRNTEHMKTRSSSCRSINSMTFITFHSLALRFGCCFGCCLFIIILLYSFYGFWIFIVEPNVLCVCVLYTMVHMVCYRHYHFWSVRMQQLNQTRPDPTRSSRTYICVSEFVVLWFTS